MGITGLGALSGLLLSPTSAQDDANSKQTAFHLAEAPPHAEVWTVGPIDHPLGQAYRWIMPDGTRWSRDTYSLRGNPVDAEQSVHFANDGSITRLDIHGTDAEPLSYANLSEHYSSDGWRYQFQSETDSGSGALSPGSFYYPVRGTLDRFSLLCEALLKAPSHTLRLIPIGKVTLAELTSVHVAKEGERKLLEAYRIDGLSAATPVVVWFDGQSLFATLDDIPYVRKGWETVWPQLQKAQDDALMKDAVATVARIAPKLTQPVMFHDVRLFDADSLVFRDHMSVVARDGHIITVAPAAETLAPVNARVIEGAGKTLLPGLWDAHFHFIQDSLGVVALAHGITTARDLGNYPDLLPLRIARIERGELLGPRIVPLLLIDGPGPYRAQLGVLATDLKSGLKQVHRAKAEGYIGIKLYGSLDPKLVAPLAAEAHSLGLRVQGHIPATMRTLDAVRAGYDEITHLNFTMMQAMPQLVVDRSNTSQRILGIARYGGDVDWHTPALSAFLDEMRDRHIAIDTTIAGYEAMYICDAGKLSAGLTPWAGVLPPDLERVSTPRTCQALPDATLDQMRAAFVKQEELISELHRRGVPIVAGTDGDMIRLVRDVELFHDSGFTPAEAIASATIVPARLSRLDGESGSIAQGKLADLILVDGDPDKRLDDLRKVDFVMRDGRLMRGDDLRSAAGFLGRPH